MPAITQASTRPKLAPWPYFGSKSRAADVIWERLGDVRCYVEPFCGSCAVLLSRPETSGFEVVGDANGFLVNTLRAIRSSPGEVLDQFATPPNDYDCVARGKWLCEKWAPESAENLRADPDWCDPKAAAWWIYITCSTIALGRNQLSGYDWCSDSVIPSTGKLAGLHREGRAGLIALGNRGLAGDHLAAIASRLRHVTIYCGDWKNTFRPASLKMGTVGLLLDPPYDFALRCRNIYPQEWERSMAASVTDICREYGSHPNARIALCGLEGEYDLPGWDVVAWTGARGLRTREISMRRNLERIWFSPNCLRPKGAN